MSHNIRMPIRAILGMNELILRESDNRKLRVYSENIRTAGGTLLGLVNDILDISSIEEGKTHITPVEYDLSCVISDLVNMIQPDADNRNIMLTLDISSDIPRILRGDDVHIKQIIMNLLNNAINNTQKGSISFCIYYEDIPDEPDSISLDVFVKDTGVGMTTEELRKLLSANDDIDSTQSLTLNIADSLLKMMGSSLEAESIQNLGSAFSFRLKQEVVSHEPLGNYEESYNEALKKRRSFHKKFTAPDASVLVMDDIPVNLMLMSKMLESSEIHTDTALTGEQAIKLAMENKYDLLIFDQILPGKSGADTLREIRGERNTPNVSTPAICLTANAVSGAREQYIHEGFDDYLAKPLNPEKLEETLMKYLPKDKVHYISREQR